MYKLIDIYMFHLQKRLDRQLPVLLYTGRVLLLTFAKTSTPYVGTERVCARRRTMTTTERVVSLFCDRINRKYLRMLSTKTWTIPCICIRPQTIGGINAKSNAFSM